MPHPAFTPVTPLRPPQPPITTTPRKSHSPPTASTPQPTTRPNHALPRRALLALPLLLLPTPSRAEAPVITDRAFFDLRLAGTAAGRLTLALYGRDSPEAVAAFTAVTAGTLRNRAGKTASYQYSVGTKVAAGRFVELGRVNQTDALNQSPGTPQRQQLLVLPPEHRDVNDLRHDAAGVLSVRRGGGAFEFRITLGPDPALDEQFLVIGRVLDGMDVVERLGKVPTNQKTIRDGYRSVGRAIGDARAKVDVRADVFYLYC